MCLKKPASLQAPQQLDEEGCARVASVLRRLPHTRVLVVGQADGYVAWTCCCGRLRVEAKRAVHYKGSSLSVSACLLCAAVLIVSLQAH